jgi:hypothetical protein
MQKHTKVNEAEGTHVVTRAVRICVKTQKMKAASGHSRLGGLTDSIELFAFVSKSFCLEFRVRGSV